MNASKFEFVFIQGDAAKLPLADKSVDLVVGSPPYTDARLYLEGEDKRDLSIARGTYEWVAWMLDVTRETLRVSKGPVVWVCAGKTDKGRYQPAPEALLWEAHKEGIACDPPVYWRRNGIPGSGGKQGFRRDVEYCLIFKPTVPLPWADNTACGHPPKWAAGGEMANRLSSGKRRNQWGGSGGRGCRGRDGSRDGGNRPGHEFMRIGEAGEGYKPPVLANPGNLLDTGVTGGGNMGIGSDYAHENEAPYPEAVPERFIKTWCPPGGIVLDPFSGSGTTVAAAVRLGRRGIGIDLRPSQCELGRRRLERPHAKVKKATAPEKPTPLFAEIET